MSVPGEWCETDDRMDWAQGPAVVGEAVKLKYLRWGDIFEEQNVGGGRWYKMAAWKPNLVGYWNGKTGAWLGYFPFDPGKSNKLFKMIKLACDDPLIVDVSTLPGK
jgi:hypothetical protein